MSSTEGNCRILQSPLSIDTYSIASISKTLFGVNFFHLYSPTDSFVRRNSRWINISVAYVTLLSACVNPQMSYRPITRYNTTSKLRRLSPQCSLSPSLSLVSFWNGAVQKSNERHMVEAWIQPDTNAIQSHEKKEKEKRKKKLQEA